VDADMDAAVGITIDEELKMRAASGSDALLG
jgi:hypothetical protein